MEVSGKLHMLIALPISKETSVYTEEDIGRARKPDNLTAIFQPLV
jgi:hypothetical protein